MEIDEQMNANTSKQDSVQKGIPENESHTSDGIKLLGQSSASKIKQKDLLLVLIFTCKVLLYQMI